VSANELEEKLADIDDPQLRDLAAEAAKISKRAFAPKSEFKVGAAVLTKAGNRYCGCNVENDSFGLTSCAERNAIFAAVAAEGEDMRIVKIAVYAHADTVPPCGACRQVMNQFGRTAVVVFIDKGRFTTQTVEQLLPHEFQFEPKKRPPAAA
jgi:cytidine deaminase